MQRNGQAQECKRALDTEDILFGLRAWQVGELAFSCIENCVHSRECPVGISEPSLLSWAQSVPDRDEKSWCMEPHFLKELRTGRAIRMRPLLRRVGRALLLRVGRALLSRVDRALLQRDGRRLLARLRRGGPSNARGGSFHERTKVERGYDCQNSEDNLQKAHVRGLLKLCLEVHGKYLLTTYKSRLIYLV